MGRELGTASSKSSKFKPSKRIRPFSVPIHKYPSAVCAIARSGSMASAGRAEQTSATPVRNRWTSHRVRKPPLRAVLEFLNNNLILVSQGILLARNYKEREVNHLLPR